MAMGFSTMTWAAGEEGVDRRLDVQGVGGADGDGVGGVLLEHLLPVLVEILDAEFFFHYLQAVGVGVDGGDGFYVGHRLEGAEDGFGDSAAAYYCYPQFSARMFLGFGGGERFC